MLHLSASKAALGLRNITKLLGDRKNNSLGQKLSRILNNTPKKTALVNSSGPVKLEFNACIKKRVSLV